MKRNVLFLMMLLFFILQNGFSQSAFFEVKLDIHHSLRINDNRIHICIYRRDTLFIVEVIDSSYNKSIGKEQVKIDTTHYIDKEQYDRIIESVKTINPNDICQNLLTEKTWIGNDGYMCKLSCGTYLNQIVMDIWSPTSDTKERNLQPFLAVCKEILSLAGLNPKKILK